jgi:uncharacterized protein (DUF433 family)
VRIEDYFDFLAPDDIRIKGHRIGIESVLYEHLYRARTPDEIARSFPTLTLEEVYATILYYLHDRERIHAYMTAWIEHGERQRAEQERNPSPVMLKLRRLKVDNDVVGEPAASTPTA